MDVNDIELFSTTDTEAKSKVVSILVRNRISYLERWEKVPLFRRREYGGARQLCVIYVNGNQYDKAKKILDEFNGNRAKKRREMEAEREAAEESRARKDTGREDTAAKNTMDDEEEADGLKI